MIEDAFDEIKLAGLGTGGDCHSDGTTMGCCQPMSNYYYWAGMAANSMMLPFGEYNY
jgi:hypothetical protein